jgi:hypothetical protein
MPHSALEHCARSGVSLGMQQRWRIVLPVAGLLLFSGVSYNSWRMRETQRTPTRYFWWSYIPLDSDPTNSRKEGADWELERWAKPGWGIFLVLSALPAFFVGGIAIGALGKLGVSQVSSFMFLMPVLIVAWYYFVGWLLDRRRHKRLRQS